MQALIQNFKEAYETNGHELLSVKIGQPVPHSTTSGAAVEWKGLVVESPTPDRLKGPLAEYLKTLGPSRARSAVS